MGERKRGGCFWSSMGCLGILVLLLLYVGGGALVAWNSLRDHELTESSSRLTFPFRTPPPSHPGAMDAADGGASGPTPPVGRIILELSEAEFVVAPAEPGDGLHVEATYDPDGYELTEELTTEPDSSWTYHLRFERKVSGIVSLMRGAMGEEDAEVFISLPPTCPSTSSSGWRRAAPRWSSAGSGFAA